MKKLLSTLVFVIVLVAAAANLSQKRMPAALKQKASDSVIIVNDTLIYDSLELHLKTVPRAQHLYTVAKKSVGRWAKLFTVIKIEESGADGKNSFFAKSYFNLTGMRYPGAGRQTTAIAAGYNYYAIFNNWHDCMVDFKHYMDVMDEKFEKKYGRKANDEYEMVNFMHGSFNVYQKWKNDVYWLLKYFRYK